MIRLIDEVSGLEVPTESFSFPDGARHIKILENLCSDTYTVKAQVSSTIDIFDLVLLKNAFDKEKPRDAKIALELAYFIGARQDRVMVIGEPLTVKVYADFINSAKFDYVYVLDAHSNVTTALLDNYVDSIFWLEDFYRQVPLQGFLELEPGDVEQVVVSPDAGAEKRASLFASLRGLELVKADKTRNLSTGRILDFNLYATEEQIKGKAVYIVDDIVTNGGTFIGLYNEVAKLGADSIHLVVTHADHQAGIDKMLDIFDTVTISNSRGDYSSSSRLTVVEVI